jgi:DNA helicase-4
MGPEDLAKLQGRLLAWLLANSGYREMKEDIFQILRKLDPDGDDHRRILYDQEVLRLQKEEQQRIAAEVAKEEQRLREEKRSEQERLAAEALRKQQAETEKRRHALLARIKASFESNFLTADHLFKTDRDASLIGDAQYSKLKTDFVREWVAQSPELTGGKGLDTEQATAVAAVDGDILVTARAGSGKTTTLVSRAVFLHKHCHVPPDALLLLAFNNTVAQKMKESLAKSIKGALPHVLTFHKLAYALVHPEEGILFDDADTDQLNLSREIQEVIDRHLNSEEYGPLIRNLMLTHFRQDWEEIVNGGFQMAMDEFVEWRRKLPRETLGGEYVKSFGEKLIANILFEHDIDYRYERNYRWDGFNYRPDFTISLEKGGVIIDFFGLREDTDFDEYADQKRTFWAQRQEWTYLAFTPAHILQEGVENFTTHLIARLRNSGVACNRLTDEEIWERIHDRAVDGFTKAMRQFIGRARKRNFSPQQINAMVQSHHTETRAEAFFLQIGISVYQGYMNRLQEANKDDFDGLIWRAVDLIKEGQTSFLRDKGRERGDVRNLRFIMIDEFQDFSQMFFELVNAIRSVNPQVQFFCVGDNWQAINAFAGSDLVFFENFANFFQRTSHQAIRTNYRSATDIVSISNCLMDGLGVTARSNREDQGWIRLCKLNSFTPTKAEQTRHNGDELTPALLRLIRHLLDKGQEIVLLSRRSRIPWYINYHGKDHQRANALSRFIEHIRSFLPEADRKRVTISTTHKYKGLQRGAVVVLDAQSYPLIHPHWIFLRVFNDSVEKIDQEERRLFYVAMTRAENYLVLLTETRSPSPYINDLHNTWPMDTITWDELPPMPSLEQPLLEIRVFDSFFVKDQLKKEHFDWEKKGKYWYRTVLAEGFSFKALLEQPWAKSDVRIKVYTESLELRYER